LFDFSSASFATAPSLPAATIDPTKAAACGAWNDLWTGDLDARRQSGAGDPGL